MFKLLINVNYNYNVEKIDYKLTLTKSKNTLYVDVTYIKRERKRNCVKSRAK
jgi:hypothetical protein